VDLDEPFLPGVAETLQGLGFSQGTGKFQAGWDDRNPWNIPGPIYVGDDDACGTGPMAAPNNIYLRETIDRKFLPADLGPYGEFVFRQPSTLFELRQIVEAAATNTTSAYAFDGNDQWTLQSVASWWDSVQPMRSEVRRRLDAFHKDVRGGLRRGEPWPSPGLHRLIDYLENGAEAYLRKYMAFLDGLHRAD
jgi:hypothetical protein